MKTQQGYFISLPDGFSVSVPKRTLPQDEHFVMYPTGLYITYNYGKAWIHYAGDKAGDSHALFEIPADPIYLRKLAREFSKLAKKIENERGK